MISAICFNLIRLVSLEGNNLNFIYRKAVYKSVFGLSYFQCSKPLIKLICILNKMRGKYFATNTVKPKNYLASCRGLVQKQSAN